VGAKQIEKRAVTLQKISPAARSALKGQKATRATMVVAAPTNGVGFWLLVP
jgi:hypothetical protein